jgi:Na+-driven multidrug efflux pump
MSLLSVNIVFFIFNNAQLTIILSFANNKYKNDEILTTAIGSVGTVMNILLYPLLWGLAGLIEILGSQSYGASKYKTFGLLLNKSRFFGYLIILFFCVFFSFSHDRIFKIWQLNPDITNLAFKLIMIRLLSSFFEFENYLMLRYIQIKGKGSHAVWILALNGLLLPLFCFLFISKLDLYEVGCGLVYLSNNAFIILTMWLYIYFYANDENILFISGKDTFEHLSTFFKFFVPLSLLSFMDIISSEMMSIFANYFDPIEYSAYLNAYSLYYLIGTIAGGLSVASSIIISKSIGQGQGQITKKIFFNMILIVLIMDTVIISLLFLSSDKIISFLVYERGDIFHITESMFKISIFCNYVDMIFYILNSTMKALGHVYLSFFIYFFSNILNFCSIYFFAFKTEMKIKGIFLGYLVNDILLLAFYVLAFVIFIDFNKSAQEVKENIKEFDDLLELENN